MYFNMDILKDNTMGNVSSIQTSLFRCIKIVK